MQHLPPQAARSRHLLTSTLTLLAVLTAPLAASGQVEIKLLPSDGEGGDWFGGTVAISGGTAIVGAYHDDDNGSGSGSAYLFDATTGNQITKLVPNDGAADDYFGYSVAISGGTAIVGAYWDDDNGFQTGSAYLFDSKTGIEVGKLLSSDGAFDDGFGFSVAISGTTAIVGAWKDDDNGTDSGSAYLFDTTTGNQIAKLLPSDGTEGDRFGHSVAISGGTVIVGAYRDDDNGTDSGSAYLFDATTGNQTHKLAPTDYAEGDRFGHSVAISGGAAIVGAYRDDDNGSDSGSAYLFDATTGIQIAKLVPTDGAEFDFFGRSVAISGGLAVVGSRLDDDNGFASGSAYFFDAATGEELAKLLPSDGAADDLFGCSVSVSGWTTVIGARQDDDNGWKSGSAYLYIDDDCNENGIPDGIEVTNCDGSPWCLDCDSDGIPDGCEIDSDPSLDQNTNGILDSCECLTTNYCIASGNSAGPPARIGWLGTPAISADDFNLTVTSAPPFKFGLFFYGRTRTQVFLGEGMLCVSDPLQRLQPVLVTDAQGAATVPLDFTAPPVSSGPFAVTPFSTWNFQFWYRDPLGGPAGFNFSDGLEVTFCP